MAAPDVVRVHVEPLWMEPLDDDQTIRTWLSVTVASRLWLHVIDTNREDLP